MRDQKQEDYDQDKIRYSQNSYKKSLKNRISNESILSGFKHSFPSEHQKMSLESNISAKAQNKFGKDMFDNMVEEEIVYNHDEGAYRYVPVRQRRTQGQKDVREYPLRPVEEETPEQIPNYTCKCPRSKCLLMYCECFSKGVYCGSSCHCYQCRNNEQFQERRQTARKQVLERDPNAFMNKLEVVGGDQPQLAYKRGCNCKRTNCFKKYCECFYAQVKCTYLCKCENCMNGGENAYKG